MSFKGQIKKFNAKTEKATLLMFHGTAFALFGSIVKRTPVDTGRLRGNWQTSINTSDGSAPIIMAKLGDSIFITNNLPYAQVIESGSSKQAPSGMVAITAAEFTRVVAANARKHRS